MTFIDQCLNGDVDISTIDDFVDQWHNNDCQCAIEEYLGFTKDEYACWVEEPESLPCILARRQ